MECWSIEKEGIKPSAITPSLQYSNLSRRGMTKGDTPNSIENKIFQEILPCFGL
jgi:hypothetical protein